MYSFDKFEMPYRKLAEMLDTPDDILDSLESQRSQLYVQVRLTDLLVSLEVCRKHFKQLTIEKEASEKVLTGFGKTVADYILEGLERG